MLEVTAYSFQPSLAIGYDVLFNMADTPDKMLPEPSSGLGTPDKNSPVLTFSCLHLNACRCHEAG